MQCDAGSCYNEDFSQQSVSNVQWKLLGKCEPEAARWASPVSWARTVLRRWERSQERRASWWLLPGCAVKHLSVD